MSDSDSNSKRGKQKRSHPYSESSANRGIIITDSKKNKSDKCNIQNHKLAPPSSRLQLLQDHNIIENVLIFLDETALFQLENTHSEMIGRWPFARQWFFLSTCDEQRTNFSLRRWRPFTEDDVKSVLACMESSMDEDGSKKRDNDSERDHDMTLFDLPCNKELLARQIGRNFAEEEIFVREREKEASNIYNFDRVPANECDIPISIGYSSLKNHGLSSSSSSSSFYLKKAVLHWHEWFDYRLNSVNNKDAFVRLSLRDGSGRFWHGFRRLTTDHRTFFKMSFGMEELIRDMRWTELESCSKQDASYTSRKTRLKTIESLMRMTQLTVSLGRKLLIATGGYSPYFLGDRAISTGEWFFHHRNYRFPLSHTTKNDLHWKPYRACLDYDSVQNQLRVKFDCDHTDLPFVRVEDIGNPNAHAHW
eukprot:jgi/Psemu1/165/gm1.165_g